MSNSNPKNTDTHADFFETTYENFIIHTVNAKRSINSNPYGRGDSQRIIDF